MEEIDDILGNHAPDDSEEVVVMLPDDEFFQVASSNKRKIKTEGKTEGPVHFNWTPELTRKLIEQYKLHKHELARPSTTKVEVWKKIADNLSEEGCFPLLNADMVNNKWRNMKTTYKTILFNLRTRSSARRWEHYEALHEVYKNVPLAPPVKKRKTFESNGSVHIVKFAPSPNSPNPCGEEEASYDHKPLQEEFEDPDDDEDPPTWFKKYLKCHKHEEEKKMKLFKQMHSDYVRLEEKKCFLLERLLMMQTKQQQN